MNTEQQTANNGQTGVKPDDGLIVLKNIRLLGLMTLAPIVKNKEETRPYFAKLRGLKEEINKFLLTMNNGPLAVLSMGMSDDYEIAIEEGSNMVRIGRAIFERTV